jgi:hypothetical protein
MTRGRLIAVLCGVIAGLGVGWFWYAEHAAPTVAQIHTAPFIAPDPSCNVIRKITEAQQALESVALEVHEPDTQIALELLNPQTCQLRQIQITKHDDELVAPSGYDIAVVERVNGLTWNYWATQYEVREPAGWLVAANAYPIEEQEKKKTTITTVIYTPYSDALNMPELVRAGRTYLTGLAQRAQQELRVSGVKSQSTPKTLIADMSELKPEFIARLVPIEHMDLDEFLLDPAWTTDRIFVLLGANRERTGAYTCNKANACGLMQFTPGTYALMVAAYPAAKLNPDFVSGARDPLNAMKAAFVLHDYNLAQFKKGLAAQQFSALIGDAALLEESLSSAYNTGASRTVAVLKAYFANPQRVADWVHARGVALKARLVAETKGYIAKLRYIREQ